MQTLHALTTPPPDSRLFLTRPGPGPGPDPKPISLPTRPRLFPSIKTKASSTSTTNDTSFAAEVSFYELLGIPETGSLVEIKTAYKQLARKYHPDVSPPGRVEDHTQIFIRVQEAYETLSDSRTRAMYDQDMARGVHLAFSARKTYDRYEDQGMEVKGDWKNRWQSQLSELKRRSSYKDDGQNMSWGARMRRQREGLADVV